MKIRRQCLRAFTTIELLVVIGIIVLLISILIPLVGKVRQSAQSASTAAFIAQLSTAIENYHQDFKAYPGPLSNDDVVRSNFGTSGYWPGTLGQFAYNIPGPSPFKPVTSDATDGKFKITMAENLVLGLLGGLKLDVSVDPPNLVYDPAIVGKGPLSLNPAQPKSYSNYTDPINLSWQDVGGKQTGAFFDEASIGANAANPTGADDSIIPEFVDRYSDPMPILYARARVGSNATGDNKNNNPVITNVAAPGGNLQRVGAYDLSQFVGYTKPPSGGSAIGVGRKPPAYYYVDGNRVATAPEVHGLTGVILTRTMGPIGGPGYTYPYDAFPYLRDPTLSNPKVDATIGYATPHLPRQKDKFILISPGPDRIYGTNDDVTNFGSVAP